MSLGRGSPVPRSSDLSAPTANGGGSKSTALLLCGLASGLSTAARATTRRAEGVSYMRQDRSIRRGVRANALWGRRGESRSNALWGSGKRGMLMLALAAMFVVPVAGSAASGNDGGDSAVVPNSLLTAAAANPLQMFDVIVQGTKDRSVSDTGK